MPFKHDKERKEKAPRLLSFAAIGALLFLHVPLLIIMIYAFTTDEASYSFPLPGLTIKWFAIAANRPDLWGAVGLSIRVALVATISALILGTLAAAAVYRSKFFGRDSISFLLVLPLALPGIVTGIALRCGCLQQCAGAFSTDSRFAGGSLDGSWS
jgi:putative spermidine/putrescine transport system permease protein